MKARWVYAIPTTTKDTPEWLFASLAGARAVGDLLGVTPVKVRHYGPTTNLRP